jgi:hypothetical protein
MTKQKIEMKRHLDRGKQCEKKDKNNNLSDNELYNLSLEKHQMYMKNDKMDDENDNENNNEKMEIYNFNDKLFEKIMSNKIENENDIENDGEINKKKDNYCEKCNKCFYHKSNLNKHLKKNICEKKDKKNNIQQNIGVQNNIINNNQKIINININYVKGFDEDWDVSKIDDKKKGEILLSNSKFSKTLENILKNDVNLNVILNNDDVGMVYKNEKNRYEPMKNKDIIEMSMEKIYKHLKDFYKEITKNNINDLSENALKNELIELERKYSRFFRLEEAQNIVKKSFTQIYGIHKQEAEKKYYELLEDEKKDSY